MRHKLLLIFIAALVLVPLTSFASDADGDTDSAYHIEGYVADTLGVPVDSVTVAITDASGISHEGTYNPETGFFSVGVDTDKGLTITFTAYGHTAITCTSHKMLENGSFALTLSKESYDSTRHTYTIAESVSEGRYVVMRASYGWIIGNVSYNNGPIKDAIVSLVPDASGSRITASTDENGDYRISCPTGTYSLSADRQGFTESKTYAITVKDNNTEQVPLDQEDIVLVMTEPGIHGDLDLAHLLMLMGVVIGILMAIGAWLLSKRLNGPNRVEIFDDNKENEELKDL